MRPWVRVPSPAPNFRILTRKGLFLFLDYFLKKGRKYEGLSLLTISKLLLFICGFYNKLN
ncbi:MAG: hypothetical protein EBZ58_13065 [Bacteroidetes bacterium]|nr:hypothetical protein [Bacteroidota bacterium]